MFSVLDIRHTAKEILFWLLPSAVSEAIDLVFYERRLRKGTAAIELELELLPRFVRCGDSVLDIGANLGAYTLKLHDLVGPTGSVHSCEPVPRTFRLLAYNCHRLRHHKNMHFHEIAVSDHCGTALFNLPVDGIFAHPNYYVGSLLETSRSVKAFPVDVVSLDEWDVTQTTPFSFLKIDIEGAEALLFQGAQKFLRANKPSMVCEVSPKTLPGVADILEPQGYRLFQYDGRVLQELRERRILTDSPNCICIHKEKIESYPLHDILAL